tara:strand:- start:1846 stop:2007 length:162 start_codon:yes stop_codon:yes gene_type:complete
MRDLVNELATYATLRKTHHEETVGINDCEEWDYWEEIKYGKELWERLKYWEPL